MLHGAATGDREEMKTGAFMLVGAVIARGVARGEEAQYVYRELSYEDRLAFNSGEGLAPKTSGGSIADQVAGKPTQYISAGETEEAVAKYSSGNGLVRIDVNRAVEAGSGFVPHRNVLEAVRRAFGRGNIAFENAASAREVLFRNGISNIAMELVNEGANWLR